MRMVKELETQMKSAARNLEFEKAAALRDKVVELRRELVGAMPMTGGIRGCRGQARTAALRAQPGRRRDRGRRYRR